MSQIKPTTFSLSSPFITDEPKEFVKVPFTVSCSNFSKIFFGMNQQVHTARGGALAPVSGNGVFSWQYFDFEHFSLASSW